MLTATLGGLIKDYRLKKRLSQLEVSLRIGWKDTTRLSKIEQGRVGKPTRLTLDKIMDALRLREQEKGQMLLASGLVPTHLEVDRTLKRLKSKTTVFNCPILVVDVAWNVFYFNDQCKKLYKISESEYKFLTRNKPSWMEMLFSRGSFDNVKIKGGYSEKEARPFKEYQIAHFKFEQESSTEEPWFRKLLLRLSQDDEFRKLWTSVPMAEASHFYEYEFNEFIGNWRGKEEVLKFHVLSIRPAFDFRYYIMIHQPANEYTRQFYKELNTR